ncbi:methyltransferase TYW3-domain-containing protein [Amylocarpus encephaloides]|uniref:tRNA(Phe) 7-[(3-amino-3-carboxypropyl)-4-demethylwyosine(37)-N(4)]-methyltransferase n=1 Tax=Amylocarpus encephaloides TaxID=45428 RepID=A0A9P7YBP8_9HELO|nr:methyltransferase TYW3-domain-containing protein [Amylocarpus encephaloides]
MSTSLPQSFVVKKERILKALSVPDEQYDDLSPKGSVDVGIRDLIEEINTSGEAETGWVTTSSCAGRISVFLEGQKTLSGEKDDERERTETTAGVGGKGGGGRWLFVSHDPVNLDTMTSENGYENTDSVDWAKMLGMVRNDTEFYVDNARLIHFKFEPMILHVLTASLQHAQTILSAALQAGFRESGALNITPSSIEPAIPMVGIRTMGLSLESIIGFECQGTGFCTIPEGQLRVLLRVANERFVENTKRIERFRSLLKEFSAKKGNSQARSKRKGQEGEVWEDPKVRAERKRAEGLRAKVEAARLKEDEIVGKPQIEDDVGYVYLDSL